MDQENIPSQQQNIGGPQTILPQEISGVAPSCKLPGFRSFFSEAISVYKSNPWTFLILAAIPIITSLLFTAIFKKQMETPSLSDLLPLIPAYLVIIIVSLWSNISLLYAVKERNNGITIEGAIKMGWSNLGSYIWISFLSFVIIVGGLILFIIPGIIFMVWFALAAYVLVNENKKGFDALKRSKELISGYVTAFWGRTMILGIVIFFVVFLFSMVIGIFSKIFQPFSYLSSLLNIVITPLSIIFAFLIYENIKKAKDGGCTKSPREIKYMLAALVLLILPILGIIIAIIILASLGSLKTKAGNTAVMTDMIQLRSAIELYWFDTEGQSYGGIDCLSSTEISAMCDKIKESTGQNPIIKTSQTDYCAYVKLLDGTYYCLNSQGKAVYGANSQTTTTFPGGTGYCDGITFNCP